MSMDAEKGGNEKCSPRHCEGSNIQNGAEAVPHMAGSQWDSTDLPDEAGNLTGCPARNMWINEQDDLGMAEDGGTNREVECPADIAIIYPPAAETASTYEETLDDDPGQPGEVGSMINKSKNTFGGAGTPLDPESTSSHRTEPYSTSNTGEPSKAGDTESCGCITTIHSMRAIRIPSDESFECSEDYCRSKSHSSCDSASVRKGRFVLKPAEQDSTETVSTLRYRKGRFQVTETMDILAFNKTTCKMIVGLLSRQNKQLDMLFDMLRNISGDERLFQKEFTHLSNEVYELIEMLKKQTAS